MLRALAFIACLFTFSTAAQAQDWEVPVERIFKIDFHAWNFRDDFSNTTPPQNDVVGSITLQYNDFRGGFGKVIAVDLVIDGYRWTPDKIQFGAGGNGDTPDDVMFAGSSDCCQTNYFQVSASTRYGVDWMQYRSNGSEFFESYDVVGTITQSIVAVPEPETYAMLLAGLGLVGAFARRRLRRQVEALARTQLGRPNHAVIYCK